MIKKRMLLLLSSKLFILCFVSTNIGGTGDIRRLCLNVVGQFYAGAGKI